MHVFKALGSAPSAEYPNVVRWYKHIESWGSEHVSLPGSSTAGEVFVGGAAAKKAAEDDDDDVDNCSLTLIFSVATWTSAPKSGMPNNSIRGSLSSGAFNSSAAGLLPSPPAPPKKLASGPCGLEMKKKTKDAKTKATTSLDR